jgi:hypothetical protein
MRSPLSIWCLILLPYLIESSDIFELRKLAFSPPAAHACRIVLANVQLSCTSYVTKETTPGCYDTNIPFLSSLGNCLLERVNNETNDQIAAWWSRYATGWSSKQPSPSIPMMTAISKGGIPNTTLIKGQMLTITTFISDDDFLETKSLVTSWNEAESYNNIFGYVLCITAS